MAENIATPRITAAYLESFTDQTVRILGRVTELRGERATLDAGGEVVALLSRDSHLVLQHAFEIVGRVNADLSVKVLVATDFGANCGEGDRSQNTLTFSSRLGGGEEMRIDTDCGEVVTADFNAVAAVVDATHRYKEIFYESGDS